MMVLVGADVPPIATALLFTALNFVIQSGWEAGDSRVSWLITTPAQHRLPHGMGPQYRHQFVGFSGLDWLFGTFRILALTSDRQLGYPKGPAALSTAMAAITPYIKTGPSTTDRLDRTWECETSVSVDDCFS
jgi:hypothetical protein